MPAAIGKTNRKSHVFYRTAQLSLTLSDPESHGYDNLLTDE